MPFDLFKEIEEDFRREKYDVRESKNLDNWVSFYFKHGRIPGNADLTILPQTQLPSFIDPLSVEFSPTDCIKSLEMETLKVLFHLKQLLHCFCIMEEKLSLQKKQWMSGKRI